MKKYYVGARHIGEAVRDGYDADCTHETLNAAISEARKRIRDGSDTLVIVQIIRVVRRAEPPIEVIDIE